MNTLNSGTRIGTMILDHFVMTFIVMIFAAPGVVYDLVQAFESPDAPPKLIFGNYYVNILAFSLYLNKDIYMGRSVAKRVLQLQVVDVKTNKPAGPFRCFLRNLTILIWPIEVVVALINKERRIGDFIAGTKLTIFRPEQHNEQVKWISIILAFLVSIAVTYLTLFYPIELWIKNSGFGTE